MAVTRTTIFALVGALAGGAIGASKVLCRDGTCVVRGTWYGAGTVGGLLGMGLAGVLPVGPVKTCRDERTDAASESGPADEDEPR